MIDFDRLEAFIERGRTEELLPADDTVDDFLRALRLARAAEAAEKALTPTLSDEARKLLAENARAERACGDPAVADAIEFILEQHERRTAALAALQETRKEAP